jgi:hypothetical protein
MMAAWKFAPALAAGNCSKYLIGDNWHSIGDMN